MNAEQIVLSRGLPKTGQAAIYQDKDDGYYQAGWWQGLSLAPNKPRLMGKTVNGDDIVIDKATGLMWVADANSEGCGFGTKNAWVVSFVTAVNLNFAGFTDWRIPNIIEISSLINYSLANPAIIQPPFANTKSDKYWSSTTYKGITTKAWYMDFLTGTRSTILKTDTAYLRCVRGGL